MVNIHIHGYSYDTRVAFLKAFCNPLHRKETNLKFNASRDSLFMNNNEHDF